MNKTSILRLDRGLLLFLGIGSLLWACNGDILKPKPAVAAYHAYGLIAVDPNRNQTTAAVEFIKDTVAVDSGSVKFDGLPLTFNNPQFTVDSVYAELWYTAAQFASGSHTLRVADSTNLSSQSIAATLPTSVSITDVTPATRLSNGTQAVKLDWVGGTNTSAYVLSAVRTSQLYAGHGYSMYVTKAATSATFPTEAFYQSGGASPDTGWYYLYVYAYAGAPDSTLASVVLPGKLPSQLADNIALEEVAGHFGMVQISAHDSVRIELLQ
jgi:hypothetical protein